MNKQKNYIIKKRHIKGVLKNTKDITAKTIKANASVIKKSVNFTGRTLDSSSEILINATNDENLKNYMIGVKEISAIGIKAASRTPQIVKQTVTFPYKLKKKIADYYKIRKHIQKKQEEIKRLKKQIREKRKERYRYSKSKTEKKRIAKEIKSKNQQIKAKKDEIAKKKKRLGISNPDVSGIKDVKEEFKDDKKELKRYIVAKMLSEDSEGDATNVIKRVAMKKARYSIKFSIKSMMTIIKMSTKIVVKSMFSIVKIIGLPIIFIILLCAFYIFYYSDYSFDYDNGKGGMGNAVKTVYTSSNYGNNTMDKLENLIAQSITKIKNSSSYSGNETVIRAKADIKQLTNKDIDVLSKMMYINILTNDSIYEDGNLKEMFLAGDTNALSTYLQMENPEIIEDALLKSIKYEESQEETIINENESIGKKYVNVIGLNNYVSPIQTSYKKCIVSSETTIPLRSLISINGELYKVVEKKELPGYDIEIINELSETTTYHFYGYISTPPPSNCTDYKKVYKCGGHTKSEEYKHNNGLIMTEQEFIQNKCNNYLKINIRETIGFTPSGIPIFANKPTIKYQCQGHINITNYYDFDNFQEYLTVNCSNPIIYYHCNGHQETVGNTTLTNGNYDIYFKKDNSDVLAPQKIIIKDIKITAQVKSMNEIKNENKYNTSFNDAIALLEEMTEK